MATIGKALFFPATVPSIPNDLGQGLAFRTWWGPTFPDTSIFGGTTPTKSIVYFAASQEGKGLTWNQATPQNESLFELQSAALKVSGNPHDKTKVHAAVNGLNMMTLAGKIDFTNGPFPGVALIPTAVGQ